MATIKIFDCNGVKELQCFDTLSDIPYIEVDEESGAPDDTDALE